MRRRPFKCVHIILPSAEGTLNSRADLALHGADHAHVYRSYTLMKIKCFAIMICVCELYMFPAVRRVKQSTLGSRDSAPLLRRAFSFIVSVPEEYQEFLNRSLTRGTGVRAVGRLVM